MTWFARIDPGVYLYLSTWKMAIKHVVMKMSVPCSNLAGINITAVFTSEYHLAD